MNNQIKITLRKLIRKPIYSIITFTGFTFAVTACLLIYIWVYNDLASVAMYIFFIVAVWKHVKQK